MARNRQRAKERQARRKAQQQRSAGDGAEARDGAAGDGGQGDAASPPRSKARATPDSPRAKTRRTRSRAEPEAEQPRAEPEAGPEPQEPEPAVADGGAGDPLIDPHLEAGAPPEDVGRSDEVLDYEQDLDSVRDEGEHFDSAADFPEEDLAPGPKGRRGDAEKHKHRPRFVQFLFAVWAELQRVQWPDRQALTTLTGVVLGFVLIAGGYLGLLDAIFSRIIQAIL